MPHKPATYITGKPCKHGHEGVRFSGSYSCVTCARNRNEVNRNRNKIRNHEYYLSRKEIQLKQQKIYAETLEGRSKQLLNGAQVRAKDNFLEFDLDYNWVFERLVKGTCELSNLPFILQRNKITGPYSPTIDRIVPEKGYIKSNCRLIIWALNAAFNNWGEDVFKKIAKEWLKIYE